MAEFGGRLNTHPVVDARAAKQATLGISGGLSDFKPI